MVLEALLAGGGCSFCTLAILYLPNHINPKPLPLTPQKKNSEGIPAIFCGLYSYFFLPNYPDSDSSKFLSADETRAIIANLPATQPTSAAKTWDWAQAKALFKDPTFVTFTLLWICHAIGGWGVSTVLPTVIYELGMTGTAVAQLMTMVGPDELELRGASENYLADLFFYAANVCFWLYLPCANRLADSSQTRFALVSCHRQ